MPLRFSFDELKAIEALTYVASKWPDITAFYVSKVLYCAEKTHLNRYARPIFGDTFIAMDNGPVPSTIYNIIKGELDLIENPEAVLEALSVEQGRYRKINAKRTPDLNVLSVSDIECLDEAMAFCRDREIGALSEHTHQDRAWLEAPVNGPMDYEAMIEGDARDAVLVEAREFAAYGVL